MSPERIFQLGLGFWVSKTLLTAVELGVFTELAKEPMGWQALSNKLGLHGRGAQDFFDALVALGMLLRTDGVYRNTPETDLFLDRAKPTYAGGLLEMSNARLFGTWARMTDGLKTGEPQNEYTKGEDIFATLYADPARLRQFLQGMTGVSMGAARAIAAKFPWADYKTFIDIGCAQGCLPVQVALAHPHLQGGGFDLPVVRPIFEEYAAAQGVGERLRFYAGDFSRDPLPGAEVLVFGHILHDWGLEQKKILLRKAFDALPAGGAVVVYEALIDDDRSKNAFGLLMSLNMLLETPEGFDYTGADCTSWMEETGFRDIRVEQLVGPDSMVIGIK